MRALLNKIFVLFVSLSISFTPLTLKAAISKPELGVAVEPMNISVQTNKVTYFKIHNDTDSEYIITTKVIFSDESNLTVNNKAPFVITSPIRHIQERSNIQIGVIYLSDKRLDDKKYYLSVSFIPKKTSGKDSITTPIVLEHQIPISVPQSP